MSRFKTYSPAGRRRAFRALVGAWGLALVGTAAGDDGAMPAPTREQLANPEWIAAGRLKFVQTCAYCHGQEGDSGKVAPFRERRDWDPQIIHDTIAQGRQRGANVMPSWKDSIPDEMIWNLVSFIRSLEGKPRPQ